MYLQLFSVIVNTSFTIYGEQCHLPPKHNGIYQLYHGGILQTTETGVLSFSSLLSAIALYQEVAQYTVVYHRILIPTPSVV